MNLEQLKHNWQKAKVNSDILDVDNRRLAEQLATGRVQTAQSKLVKYYRRSFVGAIMLPLISPMLVNTLELPVWAAAIYAIFGVIMAILNISFSHYIKRCDYTSYPVVTALAKAVNIARYQRYIRAFGLSTGAAVIITMFTIALDNSDYHLVAAFVIGLIGGCILGVIKFRRMSALTKQMQDELKSLLRDQG